jgi:uncharacterized protein (DUF952 family)/GNAT superfamily N-acetyltransferase
MSMEPRIYHICAKNEWEHGADPWTPSEVAEGFIHCSFRRQVGPTLKRFFSDNDDQPRHGLMVLEIDPFLIGTYSGGVIKAEPGTGGETDRDGNAVFFPHLYGALPRAAVTAILPVSDFLPYEIRVEGDSPGDHFTITDDPNAVSIEVATEYLGGESYWAQGRSREIVVTSIENSYVLTLVAPGGEMVGMARIITDWATMYYVSDLFVLPAYRGNGLGKRMVESIVDHPRLRSLKGVLRTKDAHSLYERYGFETDTGPNSTSMRRPPPSSD